MEATRFDLNIEEILEDWTVAHAVRELIANAIDEEVLSGTSEIQIAKLDRQEWSIRDFGRGLHESHLTQKENSEKREHPRTIGKFGIGLKDALATLHRQGIEVLIKSRFGEFAVAASPKHGFEGISTLHAFVRQPSDANYVGTEVILQGCSDADIEAAKHLFVRYSNEIVLEETELGQVMKSFHGVSRIYVNGVRVAEEDNFLFSYNITSLTQAIRKALNRERTNVGRTAYTDRVKSLLLSSSSQTVADALVTDLERFEAGTMHDELKWADVSFHACRLLNSTGTVTFLTPSQIRQSPDLVNRIASDGYRVITIPETVQTRISGSKDVLGEPIRDLDRYETEWRQSLEFEFIPEEELEQHERETLQAIEPIIEVFGGWPGVVKEIKISENLRTSLSSAEEVTGLWQADAGRIIVKRSQLQTIQMFAGTILHELCHAASDAEDATHRFEEELTSCLGLLAAKLIGSAH